MAARAQCPFCNIEPERIIQQNQFGFVVRDGFPVSPGHSLIVPKKHLGSFFDLSTQEQHGLIELLNEAKQDLSHISLCHPERSEGENIPVAFNVGINDGPAAGQTVPHCHIHLIPRYAGDVEDPRGGVRWVIADKADYWSGRE